MYLPQMFVSCLGHFSWFVKVVELLSNLITSRAAKLWRLFCFSVSCFVSQNAVWASRLGYLSRGLSVPHGCLQNYLQDQDVISPIECTRSTKWGHGTYMYSPWSAKVTKTLLLPARMHLHLRTKTCSTTKSAHALRVFSEVFLHGEEGGGCILFLVILP